jgi:plastocyanin
MLRRQLSVALVVGVLLIGAEMPGTLEARTFSTVGTISVTAGVPHELSFRLSPARITSPTEIFKVTNRGKLAHSFKICTSPTKNDKANTCTGVATKVLAPDATATVKVTLTASGTYEYLSGSASQAASGMKGLVIATLTGGASSSSGSTNGSSSTQATTTSSSSSGGSTGGVVNGAATDPACAVGTTVPVGPNTGDEDDDNEGGFPSDGDGCL